MAMKIKSYEFDSLSGNVPGYGESITDISRPGVDGHIFRLDGKRGKPFQLQGFSSYSSSSDAVNDINNFASLIGTFVIVTQGEVQFSQVLVINVETMGPFPLGAATNGMEWGMKSFWTLQRAG